tara:strand:- start:31378 stop:31695 length:318 start_codon:yes stop_codon:yes gene_type:complete
MRSGLQHDRRVTVTDILDEREKTHGDYYRTAGIAQGLKDVMRRSQNWDEIDDTEREALEMIATKIGRILSGYPHEIDHWRDIAGYATLVERWLRPQAGLETKFDR